MNPRLPVTLTISLAILLLTLVSFQVPVESAPIPVHYFTDNIDVTHPHSAPTEMELALIGLIDDAVTTIDLAIYDFNRDSIRDALLAAHARGVAVRVVTDDGVRHENNTYLPYYRALENAGIPVVDDQRPGSTMHNKFFIVDARFVWTGSTNMSDNGFTLNHNNALLLDSPAIAAAYQTEFEQMFGQGSFSNDKQPGGTQSFDYHGIPIELYFSPTDEAMYEIIAEVQSATESIAFAIFYLTFDELRDALIERAQSGVAVRAIWDASAAGHDYSDDESLCAAGIPLKTETFPGKMHNKFMVIDANGPNPRVITGSMNWSANGNERNDENTLIIRDRSISQSYQREFDTFFTTLSPESGCNTDIPPFLYTVNIPVVMDESRAITPLADVRIASIVYNPPGDDVSGERVIIENRGNIAADLWNWTLSDEVGATYTFPVFNLEPGTQVAIWLKSGTGTQTDLYWDHNSPVWNNDGDTATLANSTGVAVDVCRYGGGGESASCDE